MLLRIRVATGCPRSGIIKNKGMDILTGFDRINNLSREDLIELVDRDLSALLARGSDDMQRLQSELEVAPKDPTLWFDMGVAANQAGLQYGMLAAERARLSNPDVEEIEYDDSGAMPLFRKAIDCFEQVLALEPEYYGVRTQMGTVQANMHRLDEAVATLRRALEDDDEDFSAAYYLACAYRDLGDEELAEKYFRRAEELNEEGVGEA